MGWFARRTVPLNDLKHLYIADDVRNRPVYLKVRGAHTLIYGVSGSGKGSAIANIALALLDCDEPTQIWFIDLKRGLEAEFYKNLTTRSAYTMEAAEQLLQDLLAEMNSRADTFVGKTRNLEPSAEYPQIVLLIDEAAVICNPIDKAERPMAQHCTALLDHILRLGRAMGISVIACTQNPRKESFPLRDEMHQRIAMALNDKAEAVMALGDAAVDKGARPWLISSTEQGTAYLYDDEVRQVKFFRFEYVPDADLHDVGQSVLVDAERGAQP